LFQGTVEAGLYLLDCFFSVFVIGSLVVFVWRGAWSLLDVFFLPDDPNTSALCSLVGRRLIFLKFEIGLGLWTHGLLQWYELLRNNDSEVKKMFMQQMSHTC